MKTKNMLSIVLCTILLGFFASCGGDDDPQPSGGNGDAAELTVQERPTDWAAATTDVDLQSTMAANVRVDLSSLGLTYTPNAQDLMAAFIDGSCRAVAAPDSSYEDGDGNAEIHYILTIKKLTSDGANASVTLKFYSAQLRHVFTASSTFAFSGENGSGLGTFESPYVPTWNK